MAKYVDINAEQGNLRHTEERKKFYTYLFYLCIMGAIAFILLMGAYWIDWMLEPLRH